MSLATPARRNCRCGALLFFVPPSHLDAEHRDGTSTFVLWCARGTGDDNLQLGVETGYVGRKVLKKTVERKRGDKS